MARTAPSGSPGVGWGDEPRTRRALARAECQNSSFLAQANARRHQAALSAAHHAIQQLQRQGRAVSFSTVAQSAGVSRGWLYRQDQTRDLISRQRALKPPAARIPRQRASADSLRQRIVSTCAFTFAFSARAVSLVYGGGCRAPNTEPSSNTRR